MRRDISIIWLEDEMEDAFSDNLKTVRESIQQKGYQLADANCYTCETIEEAREILDDNSKRIDFFISDYNLGEEEGGEISNGIEFLDNVRNKGKYKQFFILYSKNYEEIKKEIVKKIETDDNLSLLNNTMVINLSSPSDEEIKREFQKAVEISLSKWDELNALRGEYMSENAEIEFELKNILRVSQEDERNYRALYSEFKQSHLSFRDRTTHDDLLKKWDAMIKKRNSLAHSKEKIDDESKDFAIYSTDGSIKIRECEINSERSKLIELKDRIIQLIKSRPRRLPNR